MEHGRILIGDDNAPNVRRWIEAAEVFDWWDGEIDYAETAQELVETAKARSYDAILTELNFRVIKEDKAFRLQETIKETEGIEALLQVRGLCRYRILWALGARMSPGIASKARQYGATHLLEKGELAKMEEIMVEPPVEEILIGDDNIADAQRWIKENKVLSWFNGRINYVSNAEDVIRLARKRRKNRYLAIVTDLNYGPGMEEEGFRILDRLGDRTGVRALWARNLTSEDITQGYRLGATLVLDKPDLFKVRVAIEQWKAERDRVEKMKRRVLLVSDDEAYRRTIQDALASHFDVTGVDHDHALERACSEKFTHILIGGYDVHGDTFTTWDIPKGCVTRYKVLRKLMNPECQVWTMGLYPIKRETHLQDPVNPRILVSRIWGADRVQLVEKAFRSAQAPAPKNTLPALRRPKPARRGFLPARRRRRLR